MSEATGKSHIGVTGLAVMGANLANRRRGRSGGRRACDGGDGPTGVLVPA
jgi:hypothetical protein